MGIDIKKFTKTYEAIQWTGDNEQEIKDFLSVKFDYPKEKIKVFDGGYLRLYSTGNNSPCVGMYLRKYNYIVTAGKNVVQCTPADLDILLSDTIAIQTRKKE